MLYNFIYSIANSTEIQQLSGQSIS